jgi:hypothetical protein
LTLDRNDALNSAVAKRDLGAFFIGHQVKIRERFNAC